MSGKLYKELYTALGVSLSLLAAPVSAAEEGPSASLPEGEGKALVEAICIGCHQTDYITRVGGYTRDHWRELVLSMIDLSGRPELDTITAYLAENFPPTDKRKPALVPGDVSISFQAWKVPTLGQQARDPVEAPDGMIWWVGQWPSGNLVGRLDPESGEMKEYPLPLGTNPHSVTPDDEGNIWVSGNGNATIVKLDPATEEFTVYEMPDPAAEDPHTMIFDSDGIMWFTVQYGNMVGRLDPESGDIKLVTMPRANSRPYGIKLDSQEDIWVSCRNANCIYRVDRETMDVREYPLPHEDSWVRRLAIASDDMVWYGDTGRGYLGRLDPETGDVKEWPSPSGPDSEPYGIEIIDDVVWYNESGKRPDALVRFDPATETFQSWAIPSAQGVYGGIVRHMRATRDGNLLIHQGSTNNILLVDLHGE